MQHKYIRCVCLFLVSVLCVKPALSWTTAEVISTELALMNYLGGFELSIDDDCPISKNEAIVSSKRKFSNLNIPINTSGDSLYEIKLRINCLLLPDSTIIYSGFLELLVPVTLPSHIVMQSTEISIDFSVLPNWTPSEGVVLPIWSTNRFGSLGDPPINLQSRALFDEIDAIIDELNKMWVRSRDYQAKLARSWAEKETE